MKQSISRHFQNVRNQGASLDKMKQALDADTLRFTEAKKRYTFYRRQIALALREKKDGFDDERYAINRIK